MCEVQSAYKNLQTNPSSNVSNNSPSFVDIILEFDPYATHYTSNLGMWGLCVNKSWLLVVIENSMAQVSLSGYGYCCPLVAITPAELKQNIIAWSRNR